MFCPDCLLYISPTFVVPLILSFNVLSRLLTLYFSHLRCPPDSFIPCSVQIAYSIFLPPSLSLSFFHSMFCPDCLLYISPTFVVPLILSFHVLSRLLTLYFSHLTVIPLILSFHVLSRLLTLYFSHLRCPSDSFIPCSLQIAYSIFIHLNVLAFYTCTIANTLIFQRKVLNRASLIPASHRRRGATTFFGENRSDTASSFS